MSGKLSRFLHLERTRADSATPVRSGAERFDALEQRGQSVVPGPSAVGVDRFRDPAAGPLELAERRPEDQPFVRCAACEADSNAFATACHVCGADLSTPEQRAFNERLWRERRAQTGVEAERVQQMNEQRVKDEIAAAAEKRATAEQLAREVAKATRLRLDHEGVFRAPHSSWAVIPREVLRIGAVVLGGAGLVMLFSPKLRALGLMFMVAAALLGARSRWQD